MRLLFPLLLVMILLIGCADSSQAVRICADKGLQYLPKATSCDVQCMNATSGEIKIYDANCRRILP